MEVPQGKWQLSLVIFRYLRAKGYQTVGQPPYVNGMPNGNGYLPPFLIGSTAQSKSVRLQFPS